LPSEPKPHEGDRRDRQDGERLRRERKVSQEGRGPGDRELEERRREKEERGRREDSKSRVYSQRFFSGSGTLSLLGGGALFIFSQYTIMPCPFLPLCLCLFLFHSVSTDKIRASLFGKNQPA
jgi:hypothetical protein